MPQQFTIVAIDVDAQKTFTPLCPDELPVAEGDTIVNELNQQASLAHYRVMSKDAHCSSALWLCESHAQMMQPTGLPEADLTWVSHAITGSYGFELLDGLPPVTEYDFCVWKGIEPSLHPYGACYHDISENISTGLIEWLTCKKADILIIGGLATDYCVKKTVLQLLKSSQWQVWVNRAACRGISPQTCKQAWIEMQSAGATLFENTQEIEMHLKQLSIQ